MDEQRSLKEGTDTFMVAGYELVDDGRMEEMDILNDEEGLLNE